MELDLRDLARFDSVLAVVAHPDDESFGLGAVLATLASAGARVRVLCLTQGEASSLGAVPDLRQVRRAELVRASGELGIGTVVVERFPDGALADADAATLDDVVERHLEDATLLVVFEPEGVTGHPDHRAATAAAQRVAARHGLATLEWGVSPEVAAALNGELGTTFVPLDGQGTIDVVVDRTDQLAAIVQHASQARDNAVLVRRLALQGDLERIRLR